MGSRYALRLIVVLVCGALVAAGLVVLNPDLGVFAVLMLANIAAVALAGAYLSVQSIRRREPLRWMGYIHVALLVAAVAWTAVDM